MEDYALLTIIAASIAGLLLTAWIADAIFKLNRTNMYTHAQMKLTAKMAEKLGVGKEEIDEIIKQAES